MLNLPHQAVVTSEWLKANGVSAKLVWWYVGFCRISGVNRQ